MSVRIIIALFKVMDSQTVTIFIAIERVLKIAEFNSGQNLLYFFLAILNLLILLLLFLKSLHVHDVRLNFNSLMKI